MAGLESGRQWARWTVHCANNGCAHVTWGRGGGGSGARKVGAGHQIAVTLQKGHGQPGRPRTAAGGFGCHDPRGGAGMLPGLSTPSGGPPNPRHSHTPPCVSALFSGRVSVLGHLRVALRGRWCRGLHSQGQITPASFSPGSQTRAPTQTQASCAPGLAWPNTTHSRSLSFTKPGASSFPHLSRFLLPENVAIQYRRCRVPVCKPQAL